MPTNLKRCDRREKEGSHTVNISVGTLEEIYNNVCNHYDNGRIGGTDYYILTSVLYKEIHERRKEQDCFKCEWRFTRHQKCNCCVRNRSMRDNYKPETVKKLFIDD